MKIFSASQIKACDAFTIVESAISSAELMERAAGECIAWIKAHYSADTLFVVLCGTGNNGGDGLAIARLLRMSGYGVKAFLLLQSNELSPDCLLNLSRLQEMDANLVSVLQPETYIADLPQHLVIIDALLGTGINRPVSGWYAEFIKKINLTANRKIAIDLPSGLPADTLPDIDDVVLKADETLSFQLYKRSFLHPEGGIYTGNVHILDIGLSATFIAGTHTHYETLDAAAIAAIYKPRKQFTHKGTYGHALLIGGSYGKMGAIAICAKAAMRAGAGLATVLAPGYGYHAIQTLVPEAMCIASGEAALQDIKDWEQMDAIGIGPGMGKDSRTAMALASFLELCTLPIVVDADALNLIAQQPDLLGKIPKGSVLTPHPKEYARLFGDTANTMIQVDNARIQAMKYNINIVLKGRHTAIITGDGDCIYNRTGNPGMATGGAGDALTGIITGLMAQGYPGHDAAKLGVYLHGLAGDIAAFTISEEALMATDIVDHIGKAYLSISNTYKNSHIN
jgi:NAD(P)H-hydrate epimerase